MKTETQILNTIFNNEELTDRTLAWVCAENPFDGHTHRDELCTYDTETVYQRFPSSELAFADALARYIGATNLVYVPALEEWQIKDDGVYRSLSGDYFVHNCIRRYTKRFTQLLNGDEAKGILGLYEAFKIEVRNSIAPRTQAGIANGTLNSPEKIVTFETEITNALWAEYKQQASDFFKLKTSLHTERGIKAISNLLKSALSEMPNEVKPSSFKKIDHLLTRKHQPLLVDGLIPSTGLGQIYGPSYTGKTFVALDLTLSVCAGLDSWLGQKIHLEPRDGVEHPSDLTQDVLYIAAEGGQPFWDAVQGWKLAHPTANLNGLSVFDAAEGNTVTLSEKTLPPGVYGLEDLQRDLTDAGIKPRLIVCDTQSQMTPNIDENSTALAHALKPLKEWADQEGIYILLVHHTGKTAGVGPRGSSAQFAMMDSAIELKPTSNGIELFFEKIKGSPKPEHGYAAFLENVMTTDGNQRAYLRHHGQAISKEAQNQIDESLMDDVKKNKIIRFIEEGNHSASKISDAAGKGSGLNRNKVNSLLRELASEDRVINSGTPQSPVWVLNPENVK